MGVHVNAKGSVRVRMINGKLFDLGSEYIKILSTSRYSAQLTDLFWMTFTPNALARPGSSRRSYVYREDSRPDLTGHQLSIRRVCVYLPVWCTYSLDLFLWLSFVSVLKHVLKSASALVAHGVCGRFGLVVYVRLCVWFVFF